jgi:undecaprenyl-diphosphatase
MTIPQALILGVVQGATEFLPISSSGHLVLVPHLLGWELPAEQAFIFNVLVQLGTLLAVLIYFRQDVLDILRNMVGGLVHREPFDDPQARLGWLLLVATIPAALVGAFFKDPIEESFQNGDMAAWFLLVTALLLVLAEVVGKRSRGLQELNWRDALWIGAFQALALLPGISRSGASIAGGMGRDLKRPTAARFSFLLAIPIMLGAGGRTLVDLVRIPQMADALPALMIGFLAAGVVGYLAIHALLRYVAKNPLYLFSGYLVLAAIITLLVT